MLSNFGEEGPFDGSMIFALVAVGRRDLRGVDGDSVEWLVCRVSSNVNASRLLSSCLRFRTCAMNVENILSCFVSV